MRSGDSIGDFHSIHNVKMNSDGIPDVRRLMAHYTKGAFSSGGLT